jgi:hypothetical protein
MKANIIPTMRYRDAVTAIDWLCRAFGFEKHLVVPGEKGVIEHAQLTLGDGMIMLGSARDDEFGRLQRTPGEVGEIDLEGELHGEMFEALRDQEVFRSVAVHPEWHTIAWPNGADFAPEFLHATVTARPANGSHPRQRSKAGIDPAAGRQRH